MSSQRAFATLALGLAFACGGDPAPTPLSVTALTPVSGPAAGGTAVTLTGTSFDATATVTFGGAAATAVTLTDSTTLTATTPAHAAGAVDVVVAVGSQSATLAAAFTFAAPVFAAPTLTAVAPAAGSITGGDALTLTGTGLRSGATVTIGGTSATAVVVASATSITCTAPAHAAGAVDVVVTNSDAKSGTKAGGYTYLPAATLASVIPGSGPLAGGTTVDLTGTGLSALTTVSFGTAAVTATVVDATHLRVTSPAGAAGRVAVSVKNPGSAAASAAGAFTYSKPASELILAVNATGAGVGALLVFDPAATGDASPNGDSIFAQATGDLTGLVAPARVLVRPAGLVYTINSAPGGDGALLAFAWQAGATSPGMGKWANGHRTGNTPPVQQVVNPTTGTKLMQQPTSLAWDSKAGQVIVGSYLTGDLIWIAADATGTVAPLRTLHTRGGGLGNVAYDDRFDEFYVLNGNTGTIDVYNEADKDNTAPKRTITIQGYNPDIAHGGDYAVDLLLAGDELFALHTFSLQVFPRLGSGTIAPTRKIAGASVGFKRASGVGYDLAKNELYVADRGITPGVYPGVYVFDRTADGNATPKRVLAGAHNDNIDAVGIYVNHDPHDCAAGPTLAAANVSLWFDAACGKSLKVTSAGVVSWTDRKAGVELAAQSGVATYQFDTGLAHPVIGTDATVLFTKDLVPGTLFGPSDNLAIFAYFKNVPQGTPPLFTSGALIQWDPTGGTGDPAHIRIHAPYSDGNIYFDSATGGLGRLSGAAPVGFGGGWVNTVALRSGANASFGIHPIATAANVYASSTTISGTIDTSKTGLFTLNRQMPGGITEFILTVGTTSAADTAAIGSYLAAKW